MKLLRRMNVEPPQSEEARGAALFEMYLETTRAAWAKHDSDELDPADGLALLSANHFLQHWADSGKSKAPSPVVVLGILVSPIILYRSIKFVAPSHLGARVCFDSQYPQLSIPCPPHSIIQISGYVFLIVAISLPNPCWVSGALSLARQHYQKLNVRTLQHETLSHFILERGTSLSTVNDGDLAMIQEALDASTIYQENTNEVGADCALSLQAFSDLRGISSDS